MPRPLTDFIHPLKPEFLECSYFIKMFDGKGKRVLCETSKCDATPLTLMIKGENPLMGHHRRKSWRDKLRGFTCLEDYYRQQKNRGKTYLKQVFEFIQNEMALS